MLDNITDSAVIDWARNAQPGDVVLFEFPVKEPGDGDAPKLRPCLVLALTVIDGDLFMTLAYGTTAATNANRGEEIPVTAPNEVHRAGLDRPTRFVGARTVTVSALHPGFHSLRRALSPVLGTLTGRARTRLEMVLAEQASLAERAASRRKHRPARPFVVERRRLSDRPCRAR